MNRIIPLIILICFLSGTKMRGQFQVNVDSLKQVISTMPEDSMKVKKINKICMFYISTGKYDEAEKYIARAKELSERLNFKKGIGNAYNFQGIVYDDQGKLALSLESYFKALKVFDGMALPGGQTDCCNNIGLIYLKQEEPGKALEYFLKAKKYAELSKKRFLLDNPINNIGTVYFKKKEYKNALLYYQQAFELRKELGFSEGCIESLNNLGNVHLRLGDTSAAFENYFAALDIAKADSNERSIAVTKSSIGGVYASHDTKKALPYLLDALRMAEKMQLVEVKETVNKTLSEIYTLTGQSEQALMHFRQYIDARDSLFNEASTKRTIQSEMNYEFEKKEAATKLEQEKKEAITIAESKKQRVIIWSICGVLILVLSFAVFAYRSFLQKKKTNIEITKQKEIIEEKQKEILDSIYYARRIQRALLSPESYISRNLDKLKKKG